MKAATWNPGPSIAKASKATKVYCDKSIFSSTPQKFSYLPWVFRLQSNLQPFFKSFPDTTFYTRNHYITNQWSNNLSIHKCQIFTCNQTASRICHNSLYCRQRGEVVAKTSSLCRKSRSNAASLRAKWPAPGPQKINTIQLHRTEIASESESVKVFSLHWQNCSSPTLLQENHFLCHSGDYFIVLPISCLGQGDSFCSCARAGFVAGAILLGAIRRQLPVSWCFFGACWTISLFSSHPDRLYVCRTWEPWPRFLGLEGLVRKHNQKWSLFISSAPYRWFSTRPAGTQNLSYTPVFHVHQVDVGLASAQPQGAFPFVCGALLHCLCPHITRPGHHRPVQGDSASQPGTHVRSHFPDDRW